MIRLLNIVFALTASLSSAVVLAVTAGSVLQNQATVSYTSQQTNYTDESNVQSIVVDRKLAVYIESLSSAPILGYANQTNIVLPFRVTNAGNSTVDVILSTLATSSYFQQASNLNLDTSAIKIWVDNGNGIFNADEDTQNAVNNLAQGASKMVFVVFDVPENASTGSLSALSLVAQIAEPGDTTNNFIDLGKIITRDDSGHHAPGQTAVAAKDKTDYFDTMLDVFADGGASRPENLSSVGTTDIPFNGQHSDTAALIVSASQLSLVKSAQILDDNNNGSAYQGAIIRYTLKAKALAPIVNAQVSDVIPQGTVYQPSTLLLQGSRLTEQQDQDAGLLSNNTLYINLNQMAANEERSIQFDVKIQ